jgi:hypothetical protein
MHCVDYTLASHKVGKCHRKLIMCVKCLLRSLVTCFEPVRDVGQDSDVKEDNVRWGGMPKSAS